MFDKERCLKSSCSALITGFGPSTNLRLNLDKGYSNLFSSSSNLFLNISMNPLKVLRSFSVIVRIALISLLMVRLFSRNNSPIKDFAFHPKDHSIDI
ncbi:hypothetical protein DERP_002434 [Dermatophagoides pteronyssinus]|uniref:Uncharacterized protein n=1 Tax=Dermatophagoides pteronyssinus TaxID=6956 RepID=A0ABQ8JHS2_DERPT|nr:hypothetical protein DERP_002434 [Dermatophagoides pteronyssinus]